LVRGYSGAVVARTVCLRGVCEMGHIRVAGVYCLDEGSARLRSWLRHFATRGAIGIFHCLNPSGRTMALGVDLACNRNEYH
jgi:hypothetical protein